MATRESDEQLLAMLALKRAKATWAEIGKVFGKTGNSVHVRCRDVRVADLAESGEPEADVKAGYWS